MQIKRAIAARNNFTAYNVFLNDGLNYDFSLVRHSQALTYGICLNELGERLVHKFEGREHSGGKFNEIALDHQSKKIRMIRWEASPWVHYK